MRLKKAFTLIELLTVIAIIAILAAIIFPVFARAKVAGYKSGDTSSMNALRSALQLYKIDQGGYPPALLGYVTTYTPGGTDVIPAGQTKGFLYPKRVDSLITFQPNYNKFKTSEITNAYWPAAETTAPLTRPIVDTNGDGKITNADDIAGARQAYGVAANEPPVCASNIPCNTTAQQLSFYKIDGYDVSEKRPGNNTKFELRYSLFWTNWAIGQGTDAGTGLPYGSGSSFDDPRQLGYSEPPETTVVTWNDYFREFDSSGQVVKSRLDIVLFLGGGAKPCASNLVSEQAWRIMP